jgi:phosphate-selective porin OprO/OprP
LIAHVGLAGFDSQYNITPANSSASGGSTTTGTFLSYRTPGRGLSNIFRAQIGGEVLTLANAGLADPSNATSQIKSKALGLEGILAYNNFKLQGEYTTADFKANSGIHATTPVAASDEYKLDTQAWYAEAMWLVTGEKYSDSYKAGGFGAIKPKNDFDPDNGKWGAWELGLRYEEYNVDNMEVNTIANGTRAQGTLSCATGGTANTLITMNGCESKSKTYTAGVKWILNPNALVKVNYSRTNFGREWEHFDLNDAKLMKHEDIFMVRTQFMF